MKAALPKQAWKVAAHYKRELHRYLLRRLRRPEDVDDVAQEIYLRLIRIDDAEYMRTPLAYLYRVAANALSDWNEVAAQHHDHVLADSEQVERWAESADGALPSDPSESEDLARQVNLALAGLPPLRAAILVMFEVQGMSYQEIASELRISVHTVEKYLTQARARIRAKKWQR
jgi:RNA polymerase sigma-19 factor, ECF subfamily